MKILTGYMIVLIAASSGAQACDATLLVDDGGQSRYEGRHDYRQIDPPALSDCPDWHDETPGKLADHCPLVQAAPPPVPPPDWYDEAPRLLAAPAPPLPELTVLDANSAANVVGATDD